MVEAVRLLTGFMKTGSRHLATERPFFILIYIYFLNSAWAAASLAIGTLYGEQET